MPPLADLLFLLILAWFMTHELDAIHQHEWCIFPLTAWMDEQWGYPIFVIAHIPLFVLLVIGSEYRIFQIGFDVFVILHAILHLMFRYHPHYTFHNRLSQVLIFGAVPLAFLHLLIG